MVSTHVGNIYNMTKISQWTYACNISMIKMSKEKYTCNKDDGNITNICHMKYTCFILATTCNMTNSNVN